MPPAPVCILTTPGLTVERLAAGYQPLTPEQEQLCEDWADGDDMSYLYLIRTTPELPGLHSQLVTTLQHPWQHGILVQLVTATESPLTSFLVFIDPLTPGWERLAEAGMMTLYHPADAPANVLEARSQGEGMLRLELQATPEPDTPSDTAAPLLS